MAIWRAGDVLFWRADALAICASVIRTDARSIRAERHNTGDLVKQLERLEMR
jgi:hypothetical protein